MDPHMCLTSNIEDLSCDGADESNMDAAVSENMVPPCKQIHDGSTGHVMIQTTDAAEGTTSRSAQIKKPNSTTSVDIMVCMAKVT